MPEALPSFINPTHQTLPGAPKPHSCQICNWPQELRQQLHDDLMTDPDDVEPLNVLCDRHMVAPAVLADHIGVCLNNSLLAYTSQQKGIGNIQDVTSGIIEGIGRSLQHAETLLDDVTDDPDLSPLAKMQLAKARTDLAKTQSAVLTGLGQAERDRITQQFVAMATRASNRTTKALEATTPTSSLASARKSARSISDVIEHDPIDPADPLA